MPVMLAFHFDPRTYAGLCMTKKANKDRTLAQTCRQILKQYIECDPPRMEAHADYAIESPRKVRVELSDAEYLLLLRVIANTAPWESDSLQWGVVSVHNALKFFGEQARAALMAHERAELHALGDRVLGTVH